MQGFIRPLTPLTFYIMTALAGADLNAYVIAERVADNSDQKVVPALGTIHYALKSLTTQGSIKPIPKRYDESVTRYEFTEVGRKMLELEIKRLKRAVTVAEIALNDGRLI
jgi:DNA-binding PadR family transcriptional regulator